MVQRHRAVFIGHFNTSRLETFKGKCIKKSAMTDRRRIFKLHARLLSFVYSEHNLHKLTEVLLVSSTVTAVPGWACWAPAVMKPKIFTFQGVLLCPHDVDQGALQCVHVEAIEWPGTLLNTKTKHPWLACVQTQSTIVVLVFIGGFMDSQYASTRYYYQWQRNPSYKSD